MTNPAPQLLSSYAYARAVDEGRAGGRWGLRGVDLKADADLPPEAAAQAPGGC